MFNNFFTPEQISPLKKQAFELNYTQKYDFTSLLQKDLFQIVSPHVQSISDEKRKIISWLKRIPLLQRMSILTYTNKQFVCLIRAMYEKKQSQYQADSSIAFTISHIEQTDEFDLMSMTNNKKLTKQYIQTQDNLLNNVKIMSRYTPFDSITFSDDFIRNIDNIFHLFDVLGDGVSHQLTLTDYSRLKKLSNSAMFYDSYEERCYKKATIGTWITQVFIKDISMKYLEYQLNQSPSIQIQLKQKFKSIQNYWKISVSQKKNQIIKKVLAKKPIQLYQQHRQIIKVTRNGFPSIQKSNKVPQLLKSIMNANQKQIVQILYYTDLSQTIQSHSILKYYITLEIEDQIRKIHDLQIKLLEQNKMKKKKKKQKPLIPKNSLLKPSSINQSQKTQLKQQNLKMNRQSQKLSSKEVMVKGTDLFYKKLEISETQEIMCIPSTFQNNRFNFQQKNQSLLQNGNFQQLQQAQQKHKKKKKNKKKKQNKDKINTQNLNQSDKQLFEAQQSSQQSYKTKEAQFDIITKDQVKNNIQRKKSIGKFSNNDKISQKSSQTTNDHLQQSHQQGKQNIGQRQKDTLHEQQTSKIKIYKTESDPLATIMKQINKKISFYNKQRKIVTNRLSYVLAQNDLSFKIYGSSICDVALPSSDIDIVMDPSIVNYFYFSYSNYKKKIINSLQYIQKIVQKFEWAHDFVLLPGATIPLLTFNVYPKVQFELQGPNHPYNNKKQIKEDIQISVDVTIEPYINMTDQVPIHLGVESTQLIKEWVSIFPFYRDLLILLKILTKNKNLNKAYHGGISSFMQSIILAGFYKYLLMNINQSCSEIEYKKQRIQQIMPQNYNLVNILLQYCVFIQKFEQSKQLMDINCTPCIMSKGQSMQKQHLCIINPLTGKIMSQRCTQFAAYKIQIKNLYNILNNKKDVSKEELTVIFQI